MTHASQGQHWYSRTGEPMYEVRAKDGSMRPATLRDARKFGWYPGVTSIIKCAAAPGLETWKQNQVLLAALTLPRAASESDESFCKRVMQDSGEQARKARDKGTEIHAAIQGHYEGKAPSEGMWPYVQGVVKHIKENFTARDWLAEISCAHPLGYGTKADLHSSGLGGAASGVVLDFKGSDFTEAEAPTLRTWDEHAMQLAATRQALDLPGADCAIVYVSRTVPGLCRIIRVDEDDLMRGWAMFCGLHTYWCGKSNYYPALWTEKEAA